MNPIVEILKNEKEYLRDNFSVEEIGLFGSYARGTAQPESDVDLLVKFRNPTLNNLIGTFDYLEKKLRKKIDLVTKHGKLSERFLKLVNKDIIYA